MKLQTASFLVGSKSDVRHWGPWPAGPVRPSGPCFFGVAKAPFVKLGGWKTGAAARRPGPFFRGLLFWCGEGAVCEAWRLEDSDRGPQARSGPCCFGVAKAPFVGLGGWKTAQTASFLVGSENELGTGARGPQARSVPQGPAVLVWRRRRL